MIKVAFKGLAGRKVRALLTALAVVIGVSMVSGTFVLTDTMQKAFDGIFTESYESTDAVVSGRQLVDFSSGGRATVDVKLLEKVKSLPSVEAASGSLIDLQNNSNPAKLLDKKGEIIGREGETLGVGFDEAGRQFSPLKLKQGEWAHGDGEIVLDAATARKQHFKIGDTVRASGNGPAEALHADRASRSSGPSPRSAAPRSPSSICRRRRRSSRSRASSTRSRSRPRRASRPPRWRRRSSRCCPRRPRSRPATPRRPPTAKDTNESLKFITYFLLGFGAIALFVGAFVILNTLSITVAQRSREFATLRTLGASRRQVMRSVVLEGLVVGLLASVLGLVLGLGIAKGMSSLFAAMGVDLPKAGTVMATRTVIVSMLTGTIVTLVASIVPALRATRVPPISAVREGSSPEATGPGRKPYAGVAVVTGSLALIAAGLFGGVVVALTFSVGVLGLFVGIAMLASRIVKPLASVVGFPAARLGGAPGRLARENSLRNPGRTASTAAALMIGLALVTVVATLGAGLRGSAESAVKKQVKADFVVTAKDGGGSFSSASDEALRVRRGRQGPLGRAPGHRQGRRS